MFIKISLLFLDNPNIAEHVLQNSVFCPAQKVAPFYEEWWFLVVVALVGLIFILLLVFILIIRGQSKKYAKKSESGECM